MSKGSARRPSCVERGEFERRYEKSFNQPWGTRAERDEACQRFMEDPSDLEMEIGIPEKPRSYTVEELQLAAGSGFNRATPPGY